MTANYRFALAVFAALFCLLSVAFPDVVLAGPYGGCTATNRTLYLAEPRISGYDVQDLQERMAELGFYSGKVDGIYGIKTFEAVKKLQKQSGLKVTGQAGPATWAVLSAGIYAPDIPRDKKPPGKISIRVDTNKAQLTVLSNGRPYQNFPCAVGKDITPTPIGEWKIANRGQKPGGQFGPRWLGLNVPWGVYGIHGTNMPYSIGNRASHGCIRMFNEHILKLYDWIPENTPVTIVGDPIMPPNAGYRTPMRRDAVGPDVVQVQLRLKEKGFLIGKADGRFMGLAELCVSMFQYRNDLEVTGEVNTETYKALGIEINS